MRSALLVCVLLSACGSPAPSPSPSASATPSPSCAATAPPLLVRVVGPGAISVEMLSGEDLEHCQPMVDFIRQTAPTQPGYCTTVALASDNPGYNLLAPSPPPLQKVVLAVGSC